MDAPELEFDWEEGLFRAVRGLWRRLRPEPTPDFDPERAAHLEAWRARLELLGRLVGPRDLQVLPASRGGGIRGHALLLPPHLELAPDPVANGELYLLRGLLGARLAGLGMRAGPSPWEDAWRLLDQVPAALSALVEELPGVQDLWSRAGAVVLAHRPLVSSPAQGCFEDALRGVILGGEPWQGARPTDPSTPPPYVPLWGRLILDPGAPEQQEATAEQPSVGGGSEAQALPVEDLERINLEEQRQLELPTHVFEKVETAEGFNGTLRQLDGADDLDDHLEALEEVELGHLVRGGPNAQALLRAEVGLEAQVPDVGEVLPGETGIPYDEWDGRRERWRRGWSTVYPTPLPACASTPWVRDAIARQRRSIEGTERALRELRARPRVHRRQLQGDDVDMDAWVDAWADRRARGDGSRRLYLQSRPGERELATLVLVDLSLSADSWVDGVRVLDICREALLVMGEVADRLGDRLAVLGFASNTRNHVRMFEVKGWGESWGLAKARIEGLRPQGYTRIGPALRHAGVVLAESGVERRQLLILTDGKPTDYDRYEGSYGLADVRRAVRDLREEGVQVHALAIDRRAPPGLTAMCGPGGWSLLHDPRALPDVLGRLLHQR